MKPYRRINRRPSLASPSKRNGSPSSPSASLVVMFGLFLTVVSIVVAVLVFYLPWNDQVEQRKLEDERERLKIEQDYALEVTRMVISSLGRDNEKEQLALAKVVKTLKDETIREGLGAALRTSTDPDVRRIGKTIEDKAKTAAPETAKQARTVAAASAIPKKDVQFFYCSTRDAGANRAAADVVRSAMRRLEGQVFEGIRVGQVRPLQATDSPALVPIGPGIFNQIRADEGDAAETKFAQALASQLSRQGVDLRVVPSSGDRYGRPTVNTISVFVCK